MNERPVGYGAHAVVRRWLSLVGALAAATGLHGSPAFGQAGGPLPATYIQQQRVIEEQIRQSLAESLPAAQKWQIDAGGWQSFYLFDFDDSVARRTQRRWDNRLWLAGAGDYGTHQFYARMQMTYIDWNAGDAYDGDEDDMFGPRADRLWYQFDLRQAVRTYGKSDLPFGLQAKVGRQYVEFGSGYALSIPLDAVLLTARAGGVQVRGLISQTIDSMPDIDRSRPDSGNMDRHILGVEASYTSLRKHTPFAYVFWNLDENPASRVFTPNQNYGYDSVYTGLGSRGELFRNTRYSTEIVYEGGESAGNGATAGRDPINALAFDALLAYLGPGKYKPVFDVEYMFASGDTHRPLSPTNAVGGNQPGTTDTSFVGFGYRDTGLSFAPRLSNIHVVRAGASVQPFANRFLSRRLRLGTDWFLYAKNKSAGAVSDYLADEPSNFLGWEMDYYVNWQITTELAATARYGAFFPGDSFSEDETRTFFLLGVTYSF